MDADKRRGRSMFKTMVGRQEEVASQDVSNTFVSGVGGKRWGY